MKFHQFASVYDPLEGDAFDELVADIKTFGLREKIVLFEGMILDGRNRFLACQRAGIKNPPTRTFKGTREGALALVESANKHRRHLTDGARALAAARISTLRQGLRADRQDASREASTEGTNQVDASREASTQTEAAKKHGVSRSSVQRAKKIVERGSRELQKAVARKEVPIKKAAAVVDLPKAQQLAAAKAPKDEPADLSEFIDVRDVEREEREYQERFERVLASDDRLAQMGAELKRAAQEIAALKQARDRYMNECTAMRKQLTAKDREIARMKKAA